jgi:hypothetical protein
MARRIYWDKIPLRPSMTPIHADNPSLQASSQTYLPVFIYGTAWKKERTENLVYQAIHAGFRAIDTAAQPKHYREDLVGKGIERTIREGFVKREDLYVGVFLSSFVPFGEPAGLLHSNLTGHLHNTSGSQVPRPLLLLPWFCQFGLAMRQAC